MTLMTSTQMAPASQPASPSQQLLTSQSPTRTRTAGARSLDAVVGQQGEAAVAAPP